MKESIRALLMEYADTAYRDFSSALIPESKPLIGVRLPQLRKLAMDIVRNQNWEELFDENLYFEEEMLEAMMIGYGCYRDKNLDESLAFLDTVAKKVNNWSVCDSFCVSFKTCEKYPDETLKQIESYLDSEEEFVARVGLVLLLDYYVKLDENKKKRARKRSVERSDLQNTNEKKGYYLDTILKNLNRPFTQGYYTGMAAAWLLAECFVTYPYHTFCFLTDEAASGRLDSFAYRKAVQKICESRIVSAEVKQDIKALKRT